MKTHHVLHLCGEHGPSAHPPTCEACQMVDEHLRGNVPVEELAELHSMPVSLVRDILESCDRRRRP